jgi:hypothetical protein
MCNNELQAKVIELVENGIKGTELVTRLTTELFRREFKGKFEPSNILQLIEDMVKEGRIREIEYVLPSLDYRVKSFYLPANTEVTIR